MIRLISGIVLLVIGGLLGLAGLSQLATIPQDSSGGAYGAGYMAGRIFGLLIVSGLSFFSIKYGIRLVTKNK